MASEVVDPTGPRRTLMTHSARRHVVVGVASGVAVGALIAVTEFSTETWGNRRGEHKADGLLWQYNISTGSVALALLVVTLAIGPVRAFRGGRRAVHLPWRRVTGVWSAIVVAAHVPGGLAMHTKGWRLWTPFASAIPGVKARPFDEFTIGYWIGAIAFVVLIPLVATSTTGALRRLGPARWKRLHRLTYLAFVLIAVHVVAMQYGEGRDIRHVALTALAFAIAVVLQSAGWYQQWRTAHVEPAAPEKLRSARR